MKRTALICSTVAILLIGIVNTSPALAQSIAGAQRPNSETTSESRVNITDTATERPAPDYPALAKAARVSGKVEVEVIVDSDGRVRSARAIAGHPLLKDPAVACAKQWKFRRRPEMLAEITGIVTIVFDLDAGQRRKLMVDYPAHKWEANIQIVRQCIDGAPTDTKTLSIALAKLAVSAIDEKRVNEAIGLYEQCEKANKLPKDAELYYGSLLYNRYIYIRDRLSDTNKESNTTIDGNLSQALQLSFQAYSDEFDSKPIDSRKLLDIARIIDNVYAAMVKSEERITWMRAALNASELPNEVRASISYELAVRLWQRSYDLTAKFHMQNQPVPTEYFPQIRELLDEAFPLIHSAQALTPTFANPWFYEKLLVIEEMKIDPSRIESLKRRAMEAQDRYMEVQRANRGVDSNSTGPYASGLPALNYQPTLPPPPPPPPPAPPKL